MAKQFAPHVYRDWLPLFMTLPDEQAAEVLKGIAGFPDYEVKGVAMWDFFKSQLEKEYGAFAGRSEKARFSASARWENANAKNEMRNDAIQCERIEENANVCERIETHKTECDCIQENANEQNKIRTDTNEYERIKTNTEEYDRKNENTNVYEPIRNDTIEKNEIRTDTNDFTKRKKEKTPPAPPEKEKNKNIYTPTDTSVCTPKTKIFVPPSVEEVRDYVTEKGYSVDPDRFVDFYTAKGWVVGRSPMKDWKASVRTWERDRQNAISAGTVVSFGVKSGSYAGGTPL